MLAFFVLCVLLGQNLLCDAARCYAEMHEDYQCYSLSSPFSNPPIYPDSPSEQEIQFELYTRHNRNSPRLLRALGASSSRQSSLLASGKVAFVIHGFTDSSRKHWVVRMVQELLHVVPNVIAVDWEEGAKPPIYPQAVANTRVVGAQIATLIRTLGVDPANVHLIGHSLGAHVAGYAGEKFGRSGSAHPVRIGRITGLDPASLLFEDADDRVRLDPSDATFVDVIHTDAPRFGIGFGMKRRVGHVDFYPNGGSTMPGCGHKLRAFLTGLTDLRENIACSHNRAPEYFIASIRDNDFLARRCRDRHLWQLCRMAWLARSNRMGYHATRHPEGLFVLAVESSYPF